MDLSKTTIGSVLLLGGFLGGYLLFNPSKHFVAGQLNACARMATTLSNGGALPISCEYDVKKKDVVIVSGIVPGAKWSLEGEILSAPSRLEH